MPYRNNLNKKRYQANKIANYSLISIFLVVFIFVLIFAVDNDQWFNVLLSLIPLFGIVSFVLSLISLVIKTTSRGWWTLFMSSLCMVVLIVIAIALSNLCVIC
ncbi:hypothetical protein [Olivibacter ginsenosidimutans]|uniref:hypothetical protein n=1 Tax=Olivibacter ginsenosidimutans TaxID=1176537 RepID=UPI0031EED9D6